MAGLPGCRLRAWDHGVGVRALEAAHMPVRVPLVVSIGPLSQLPLVTPTGG